MTDMPSPVQGGRIFRVQASRGGDGLVFPVGSCKTGTPENTYEQVISLDVDFGLLAAKVTEVIVQGADRHGGQPGAHAPNFP